MTATENSTETSITYECRSVTIVCASMARDAEGVLTEIGRYTVQGLLLPGGRLLTMNAQSGDSLWASLEDYEAHGEDAVVEIEESTDTETLELAALVEADQGAVRLYDADSLLTDEEWDARPWPRTFELWIEGNSSDIEAESLRDARKQAREQAREGWGAQESTHWVDWELRAKDKDGHDEDVACGTVAIDPDEPECGHTEGHDWRSPYSLLGGLQENPGVQGHGGGVIYREVCVRCGCERITDTWAQRPDNGEQGLTSVRYEEGAHELGNELQAIRWDGVIGEWCDRFFTRGLEAKNSSADNGANSYDSREQAVTALLEHAESLVRRAGYDGYLQATGDSLSLTVPVADDGEGSGDETKEEIAEVLGERFVVEWSGSGNTDADGETTSDLRITIVGY
jgi:hypothetical protein